MRVSFDFLTSLMLFFKQIQDPRIPSDKIALQNDEGTLAVPNIAVFAEKVVRAGEELGI